MRITLRAVLLTVLAGAGVSAQGHPDFTGRWILEAPGGSSSDAPRSLLVRQSLDGTTGGVGPATPFFSDITIERDANGLTRSETYRIGLQSGVVPGIRADGSAGGPRTRHAVQWDGTALVFESSRSSGDLAGIGDWAERREVWSLDSRGRLHVVITTRSSGAARESVTLVYRRP
jgi:hypothetical protein